MHPGTVEVLADLIGVSAAFLLLAAAGLSIAVAMRVKSRPAQAIFALATPCVIAYLASGFYLLSPGAGDTAAIIGYVAVALTGVALAIRLSGQIRQALRWWAAPALMTVAGAAVGLGFGFLHGGTNFALREDEIRYVHWLANDNVLPHAFAVQLLAARRPLPHILSATGPWLSSDRPPMETSLYLMIRAVLPVGDPVKLLYQTLGTFLQSLWIPAVWCLFYVAGLPRRVVLGALITIVLTGFILFNSFYVWPKLFPAAFVVLLVAFLVSRDWSEGRSSVVGGVACGVGAAVAMLGHAGSALVLVPLAALVICSGRLRPRLRSVAGAVVAFVALMLPWILYQRYYDPPGNSLPKLQLAGTSDFNPHVGLLTTIVRAYQHLSVGHVLANKWSNLVTPFEHELVALRYMGVVLTHFLFSAGSVTAVDRLRALSYLFLAPALGLLALGPFAHAINIWLAGAWSPASASPPGSGSCSSPRSCSGRSPCSARMRRTTFRGATRSSCSHSPRP